MTTQLTLYNGALLVAGERFIASLSVQEEPRRLLDQVWTGAIKYCLEQGQWHFAMRTIQIDYDSSIEPDFGYRRAFVKPDDWVNTSGLCSDEYFTSPLTRYIDEAGYWYADLDTLYVRYVSNDSLYGMDLNKWPETFREYVEAYLASRILLKIANSEDKAEKAGKLAEKRLMVAKNKAAMAEPTSFPARGSWSSARNRFPRRDGGGGGSLIG
jgi:uncharacterized protein YneR